MTPLTRLLRERIARDGPISVEEYMSLALGHPSYGYYTTRNPFGHDGDFVTAPEVSQIFGELLGLWCVDMWQRAGSPANLHLIELGPGLGTLLSDALRAARVAPAFVKAVGVHLVETSPVLAEKQKLRLGEEFAHWHASLSEVPVGPALILANEFFDALPIRQFVRTDAGWAERGVALSEDRDGFEFVDLANADDDGLPEHTPIGAVYERSPRAEQLMGEIAERICTSGGALLMIDYGYVQASAGETLQAVRGHAPVEPLQAPGEADLTAHVNFEALAQVARGRGARVHGPVAQSGFLRRLGAETRAVSLYQDADESVRGRILTGLQRLIDPSQMGVLFKAMCVTHPAWPEPDGMPPCS